MDSDQALLSYAPSSLDLAVLCAASTQEVKRRDRTITTPEMARGTLMHAANEAMVLAGPMAAARVLDEAKAPAATRAYVAAFWIWFDGTARAELLPALSDRSLIGILAPGASQLRPGLVVRSERLVETIAPPGAPFRSRGRIDLTVIDEDDEHAWIIDYKAASGFRRSLEESTMQMLAYVAGVVRERPSLRHVTVHLIGMLHNTKVTLELQGQDRVALAVEASDTALLDIHSRVAEYTSGQHCGWCPARASCAHALAAACEAVEAQDVAPYVTGAFAREDDVLRYLVARPVLMARLAEADRQAKAFVSGRGGRGIADPVSGRVWRERAKGVDTITGPMQVVQTLIADVGLERGQAALKNTKKEVEAALKDAGRAAKERRAFWAARRADGSVTKVDRAEWAWADDADADEEVSE